jgi:dGTPase
MNWQNIFTDEQQYEEKFKIKEDNRSKYQRDFDKLVFYSGFRRLQNKTQVFPLPKVAFVHNRLTHSFEVASVGRSLGKLVGERIVKDIKLDESSQIFYKYELPNVIAAGCLAHDIGNPPFGHSGEKAIAKYFIDNQNTIIDVDKNNNNKTLRTYFDEAYWTDLIAFEGNANGFRILTNNFNKKNEGGLNLTLTTLASTLKYPCSSLQIDDSKINSKKYNYFQSEISTFQEVCSKTNMKLDKSNPKSYFRHPFTILVEAADDICNAIIDLEDAHRIGILSYDTVSGLLTKLINCVVKENVHLNDNARIQEPKDHNEYLSNLRTAAIDILTVKCAAFFDEYKAEIIAGKWNDEKCTLFDLVASRCDEVKEIQKESKSNIYNHNKVIKIELTGYKILYDLLNLFIPAVLRKKEKRTHKDEKIVSLIPDQFQPDKDKEPKDYLKVMSVLDFISGMTDLYAIQLYRDLHGIEITEHK